MKQFISSIKKYYRSKDDEPVNITQYEDNLTVKILMHLSPLVPNKKYFNPVSLLWMKAKSIQLIFPPLQNPVEKKTRKYIY